MFARTGRYAGQCRHLLRMAGEKGDGGNFFDAYERLQLSNASKEYAAMLSADEWRDVPVIIRLVPIQAGLTADDCGIIFSGNIDDATITNEVIELTLSNDLAAFELKLPRENYHRNCRFAWGDDMCGARRLAPENYKASKTVGNSSTTTVINSNDLTEDTWGRS